jgi:hypothetical protein
MGNTPAALLASATDDTCLAVERALLTLQEWVEKRDYSGYEPFDILNSQFLELPFVRQWPLAIVFIQFAKRFAGLRLRRWLRVPQSKNPKALGLFLSAYCDLARCGCPTQKVAAYLKSELKRLRSPNEAEYCWGYDWDHISRAGKMPAFSPNCIATCFCAHALLDLAEVFGDAEAWEMAQSAGRFILTRLNRSVDTPEYLCLSYTTLDRMKVYNASAHAGALLARLAPGDDGYSQCARRVMNYLAAGQQRNGEWYYGPAVIHHWIDSFHTAYNLGALLSYRRSTCDNSFDDVIRAGYDYYVSHFFGLDGAPKYFSDSLYPIDIHSCSQAIVTFCDFVEWDGNARNRALAVARWTLEHMRGSDGTFFFQAHRFWTNRTPYMRWGQAWMFYALARLKRQFLSADPCPMKDAAPASASKPELEACVVNAQTPTEMKGTHVSALDR